MTNLDSAKMLSFQLGYLKAGIMPISQVLPLKVNVLVGLYSASHHVHDPVVHSFRLG